MDVGQLTSSLCQEEGMILEPYCLRLLVSNHLVQCFSSLLVRVMCVGWVVEG